MGTVIEDLFGDTGPFAAANPEYARRPQQVYLAEKIYEAMEKGEGLVAEAPTGVGKSFAYLAPAFRLAESNRITTVIATPNKRLQDQLIRSDVPAVAKALGSSVVYRHLKGVSSYLCLLRCEGHLPYDGRVDWNAIEGEMDRVPFHIPKKEAVRITIDSSRCLYGECPYMGKESLMCYRAQAKEAAMGAQVLVVNFHLLLLHAMNPDMGILPGFQRLVLDEAHNLAEIARDFLSRKFTRGRVLEVIEPLRVLDRDAYKTYADQTDLFFDAMQRRLPKRDSYSNIQGPFCPEDGWEPVYEFLSGISYPDRELTKQANRLAQLLESIATRKNTEDVADVVHKRDSGGAELRRYQVSAGPFLERLLFKQWPVVCTSATLTVDDKPYFFARNAGIPKTGYSFETVDSPFDWKKQSMLYVDGSIVRPPGGRATDEDHAKRDLAVAERINQIAEMSNGGVLVLMVRISSLHAVVEYLKTESRFTVYSQKHDGESAAVDKFRQNKTSILVGTKSYWEGLDIPGDTCRCVVIDKISFPKPDPVLKALEEKDPEGHFMQELYPRVVISFKQGFGRAIRRTTDRKAVALLDPRVWGSSWGSGIRHSVPSGTPVTRNLRDLERFFEK